MSKSKHKCVKLVLILIVIYVLCVLNNTGSGILDIPCLVEVIATLG
jgi:hypothetical protein